MEAHHYQVAAHLSGRAQDFRGGIPFDKLMFQVEFRVWGLEQTQAFPEHFFAFQFQMVCRWIFPSG